MKLNLKLVQQILDIANIRGEQGFTTADVLSICHNNEDELELISHLDHLADKGFIVGEFMPISVATVGVSPQSVRFIRGTITERGKEYRSGLAKVKPSLQSKKLMNFPN